MCWGNPLVRRFSLVYKKTIKETAARCSGFFVPLDYIEENSEEMENGATNHK